MGVRTCLQGLHDMDAPGNTYATSRGCRPCKLARERARRAGQPWDGPGRGANRGPGPDYYERRMPAAELARLRSLVGACVGCGWTPDAGRHPRGCPVIAEEEASGVAC